MLNFRIFLSESKLLGFAENPDSDNLINLNQIAQNNGRNTCVG